MSNIYQCPGCGEIMDETDLDGTCSCSRDGGGIEAARQAWLSDDDLRMELMQIIREHVLTTVAGKADMGATIDQVIESVFTHAWTVTPA